MSMQRLDKGQYLAGQVVHKLISKKNGPHEVIRCIPVTATCRIT